MTAAAQTFPIDNRVKVDWTSLRPWIFLVLISVQLTVIFQVAFLASAFTATALAFDSRLTTAFFSMAMVFPFWVAFALPLALAYRVVPNPVHPEAVSLRLMWSHKPNRLPLCLWYATYFLLNAALYVVFIKHFEFYVAAFIWQLIVVAQTPQVLSVYIAHVLCGKSRQS